MGYWLSFLVVVALLHCRVAGAEGQLSVGFYSKTCPDAESIVTSVVKAAVQVDRGSIPVLLRLHYHDCFVEGCDGSILIDSGENEASEHVGVGGFEVVEEAKTQLEKACPGVVSCADIVALMARDAIFLGKGSLYDVPTGRRDGRVSKAALAVNMPKADDSIELLKSLFREKGLSDQDLVLLSAAHTVGKIACVFMQNRLYNFSGSNNKSDPAINPRFLGRLEDQCPQDGSGGRVSLDPMTDTVVDDRILSNIRSGFAVIASDARLYDDKNTKQIIDSYIGTSGKQFSHDFAAAMVRMGSIGVKTGSQGEIRRVCSKFN